MPRWRVACVLAAATALFCGAHRSAAAPGESEIRALWVQRTTLTSAPAIVALVETAKANGFNTLIVQVRGRGDAYYTSSFEPRGVALQRQHPSFDPLTLVLTAAHHLGIQVHAWMNVDLIADADVPTAPEHVALRHPEWLMVPKDLALQLREMNPRNPEYLAALARYAKEHSSTLEGLYLSPIQRDAADYTASVVADLATRYDVDGIHLDYARFPNEDFDYSANALAEFRADVATGLTAAERREYDDRTADRPLFYTQMFPQRWQDFRRARTTELVTKIRTAIRAARPSVKLSAAVWPDPAEALTHRFQDWRGWLTSGLLDIICPMAYTVNAGTFRSQIATTVQAAAGHDVWAGIGAYHISAGDAVDNIKTARRLGVQGVILFSYDNLTPDVNADPKYLGTVARGAFQR